MGVHASAPGSAAKVSVALGPHCHTLWRFRWGYTDVNSKRCRGIGKVSIYGSIWHPGPTKLRAILVTGTYKREIEKSKS